MNLCELHYMKDNITYCTYSLTIKAHGDDVTAVGQSCASAPAARMAKITDKNVSIASVLTIILVFISNYYGVYNQSRLAAGGNSQCVVMQRDGV